MRRSLPARLALSALLTACGAAASTPSVPETRPPAAPSSTATVVPPTTPTTTTPTTTTPTTTTTTTAATTTTAPEASGASLLYPHYRTTQEYAPGREVDIHAPEDLGPWPVVVTVHGGGWFAGSREAMGLLADGLAERGVVAFNASYRTIALGGRFPETVDDVACAVAYARESASAFTTTPDQVFVVGHSAGAHLGALVAFAPGEFGDGCAADTSGGADGLVGLAGPYDTDQLSFLLAPFFGTDIDEDPGPWRLGNPLTWLSDAPDVPVLLVHGAEDNVVPVGFSEGLEHAVEAAGGDVRLEVLSGVDHLTVNHPRVVGDLIAGFLAEKAG